MKVSDLIRQVNRDTGDTYENTDIIDWFNRCSDDLSEIIKKEEKKITPITSENRYTIPSDFYDFHLMIVENERFERVTLDSQDKGFKLWSDEFSLNQAPDSGTIDLYYYRKLARLTVLDDEPEIPSEFHDLYILYAVGHMQFTEEDYDDRPDLLQRYYQRKDELNRYIHRKQRQNRVNEKVKW